jgi:hypothetical protein
VSPEQPIPEERERMCIDCGMDTASVWCLRCDRCLGAQDTRISAAMTRMNDSIDVCPIHRDQAVVVAGKIEVRP